MGDDPMTARSRRGVEVCVEVVPMAAGYSYQPFSCMAVVPGVVVLIVTA